MIGKLLCLFGRHAWVSWGRHKTVGTATWSEQVCYRRDCRVKPRWRRYA